MGEVKNTDFVKFIEFNADKTKAVVEVDGERRELEYKTGEEIYELNYQAFLINEKMREMESLELNNHYIDDFSIEEMVKYYTYKLDRTEIDEDTFKALLACIYIEDFASCIFNLELLNFRGVKFVSPYLLFNSVIFCCEELLFDGCQFLNTINNSQYIINFSNVKLLCNFSMNYSRDISKNIDGIELIFRDIIVDNHDFRICYMNYTNSRILFYNVDFYECDVDINYNSFINCDFDIISLSLDSCLKANFNNNFFLDSRQYIENLEINKSELVTFKGSKFSNKLDLTRSKINATTINFVETEFKEGVDFTNCNLDAETIDFTCTDFGSGEISFKGVNFFNSLVNFTYSNIENCNLSFYESTSRIKLLFDKSDFKNNKIDFEKSIMRSIVFQNCEIGSIDLRAQEVNNLSLKNVTIVGQLKFPKFPIEKLSLSEVFNTGKIFCKWTVNELKQAVVKGNDSYENRQKAFHILKENFHSIGRYNDEDRAYIEFKKNERKRNFKKKKYIHRVLSFPIYTLRNFIFEDISLYGTSPFRVLITMIATIFFFAFIFIFVSKDFGFLDSVYFSMITFLTIGYGDLKPESGCMKILAGVEGFIGLFLIAYFTIAFSRKVLR